MQVYYDGAHSVLFGEIGVKRLDEHGTEIETTTSLKNSWKDWHLIPTSRPVVDPPPVKKNTIEIIGANSLIDLTEVPRGFPTYGNRTGSFEFYVDHSTNWGPNYDQEYDWIKAFNEIKAYLHGYKMRVYLGDDLENFYYGRLEVKSWKTGKNISTIAIDYDFDPYMLSTYSTLDEWLWNPFEFEWMTIPDNNPDDYKHDLSEGYAIIYPFDKVGAMPVAPKFYFFEGLTQLYAQTYTSYSGKWSPIVPITPGEENLGLILSTPRAVDMIQINFYSDLVNGQGVPATSGVVGVDFRPGRL